MEYLFIVLAIIWFVVKNSVKKEKNNAGKKPGAAAPSAASSVRMTPEEVEARKAEIRAKLQSLQGAAQPQAVSTPAAPAPAAEIPSVKAVRPAAEPAKGDAFPEPGEGFSYEDEDGCVGGSITHPYETEGVSYSDSEGCVGGSMEHGHTSEGRLTASARKPDPAANASAAGRRVKASDMRRAIVTSEILSRPVAMR